MTNTMGHQAELAMDTVVPIDISSEPYEFISEDLTRKEEYIDTNGIKGTRQHDSSRVRKGQQDVSGTITLPACPAYHDDLLPRILGGTESPLDQFNLGEAAVEFPIMIDRGADAFLYGAAIVSRAVWAGGPGELLTLALDILAKTEADGQSFPALTHPSTADYAPLVHSDGVLTLNGNAFEYRNIEIEVDNGGEVDYTNSVTGTCLDWTDLTVTLRANVVWDSTNKTRLYETAVAGIDGTVVFTNGTVATTFTFGKLQIPDQTPGVGGRGRVEWDIELIARRDSGADALIVTNDATV